MRFVHHWVAHFHLGQVAQHGVAVGRTLAPFALAAGDVLVQLGFGNDGDLLRVQLETVKQRRVDQAQRHLALGKAVPVVYRLGLDAVLLQRSGTVSRAGPGFRQQSARGRRSGG